MTTTQSSALTFNCRTPGEANSEPVRYTIGSCLHGSLLVAKRVGGICAIFLGDTAEDVRRQLMEEFRGSTPEFAPEHLSYELEQVRDFVDHPDAEVALDFDVEGTAFQHRVWKALLAIPAGETLTYARVATKLGLPSAVRAVASACAANKLALMIPCHRVVRSDGTASGYRWGTDRKRRILAKEAAQ